MAITNTTNPTAEQTKALEQISNAGRTLSYLDFDDYETMAKVLRAECKQGNGIILQERIAAIYNVITECKDAWA